MPKRDKVSLEDPSEYRPELGGLVIGKEQEDFRIFHDTGDGRYAIIRNTYLQMHTQQTVEYSKKMVEKWGALNSMKMTIMEAVEMLDDLVDESDPDTSLPNSLHAFQTAERIREAHPDKDWFHLTGLIHDLGKVMALYGQPQWSTVGDTFPVGCKFSEKCVFHELFKDNPDASHPIYSAVNGMYEPNCGLDKVMMSFGHDEYMYRVLVGNGCKLPEEALYMVRYHSFYPWHTGGAYSHLCNDKDMEMIKWIREFKYSLPDPLCLSLNVSIVL
jgi:inositol oxygenase